MHKPTKFKFIGLENFLLQKNRGNNWKITGVNLTDGEQMYDLAKKIFPIPRSITGDSVRQTFGVI